jgi:hypothetical protein
LNSYIIINYIKIIYNIILINIEEIIGKNIMLKEKILQLDTELIEVREHLKNIQHLLVKIL